MFAAILIVSSAVIALIFVGYPLSLWLRALAPDRRFGSGYAGDPGDPGAPPTVTFVVAVRNGERLIGDKVRNCLSLQYPADALEVIVSSDGSTDGTDRAVLDLAEPRVRLLTTPGHEGKAAALNRAAAAATGEVLVFTDADALLAPHALEHLVAPLADPTIGGVCGQRVLGESESDPGGAQSRYVSLDSRVKELESRVGSITSNDGKLYCIRRSLFRPIPAPVTDDFFTSLSVVAQGHRFVFEPRARALVRLPSRSPGHELRRRRRIVARSLRGILIMRRLLNPLRYGSFAVGLTINKVGRRLLPVCLALVFVCSAALAPISAPARALLALQVLFYGAAASHALLARATGIRPLQRLTSTAFYFCLGNLGTLLGLADFLAGRRVARWEPRKAD